MSDLTREEQEALLDYCAQVRSQFGSRVLEMRLFGSAWAGNRSADSDVDVFVLLDTETREDHQRLYDLTSDFRDKSGVWLSATVMGRTRFEDLLSRERRIAREIRAGQAL